jgi:DNA-binding CsgD family transcriptional regulator
MTGRIVVALILLVQVLCSAFFVSDILASVLGIPTTPVSWQNRELIEIGAAVGLVLGVVLGGLALRKSLRATHRAEEGLRRASAEFMVVLEEHFADWELTPAERDVALFAIKGMSTTEIAALRNTSEGTVKAQTAAIYRKAGVTGRPQLLSLFIEDLMRDDVAPTQPGAMPLPALVRARS